MKFSLGFLALASSATAATSFILPGSSEHGFWDLNAANYNTASSPAYPVSGATSTPWGGPIAASSTSATFTRLTGDGYFIGSGSGIYGSFNPVTYRIADSSPVPNLANLIFQARTNLAPAAISLSFNGGNQALLPDFSNSVAAGSSMFGSISDVAWQWDLSAYAGTISSYEITIGMPGNSLIYGNAPALTTIAAGDRFLQVVPEPSSALLALTAAGITLIRRRRA